jgi:hypothetical protein
MKRIVSLLATRFAAMPVLSGSTHSCAGCFGTLPHA